MEEGSEGGEGGSCQDIHNYSELYTCTFGNDPAE